MVKKKLCKRRTASSAQEMTTEGTTRTTESLKREHATQAVQHLYDKNPDTSVYSRRYQYKKQQSTED